VAEKYKLATQSSLQVDYGRDETALIHEKQVHKIGC
jgi:hypothetical protein